LVDTTFSVCAGVPQQNWNIAICISALTVAMMQLYSVYIWWTSVQ